MDLAVECYGLTKGFPKEETFGLTSQIRRAAASIAANVAEGYGRDSPGQYVNFLRVAQGSLKELETMCCSQIGLASSPMGARRRYSPDQKASEKCCVA